MKITIIGSSHGVPEANRRYEASRHGFPPFAALEQPLDLLIGEAAHFEAEEYLPVFEKCHIKKFCVTHYTDHFLPGVIHLCETLNSKEIKALRATDDLEIVV